MIRNASMTGTYTRRRTGKVYSFLKEYKQSQTGESKMIELKHSRTLRYRLPLNRELREYPDPCLVSDGVVSILGKLCSLPERILEAVSFTDQEMPTQTKTDEHPDEGQMVKTVRESRERTAYFPQVPHSS